MTQEEYSENVENKVLFDTKIHEDLIARESSSELKENNEKTVLKQMDRQFNRGF